MERNQAYHVTPWVAKFHPDRQGDVQIARLLRNGQALHDVLCSATLYQISLEVTDFIFVLLHAIFSAMHADKLDHPHIRDFQRPAMATSLATPR